MLCTRALIISALFLRQHTSAPLDAGRYGSQSRPVVEGIQQLMTRLNSTRLNSASIRTTGKFGSAVAGTFALVTLFLFAASIACAQSQPNPATQPATGQVPAPAQPAATPQQPTTAQEAPDEEISSSRRKKIHANDFRKWTYDIGGGANLPTGTTKTFVKGGGAVAEAGVTRSYSKYFGFRLDGLWVNLPLRDSALRLAQAGSATSQVYAVTLDPMFSLPLKQKYSIYALVGPAFLHRSGEVDSSTYVPGSSCNTFWDWWGTCRNGSVSVTNSFLKEHQNEFAFNYGVGLTRKWNNHVDLFAEFRSLHGSQSGIKTDTRPITIGVRW
jgi:hypothetical protein